MICQSTNPVDIEGIVIYLDVRIWEERFVYQLKMESCLNWPFYFIELKMNRPTPYIRIE